MVQLWKSAILHIRQFLYSLLNILLPPRCLICNIIVSQTGSLCADCWQEIEFNTSPHCAICSHPFTYDIGELALCGSCIQKTPPYARIHTVFHYNEKSRTLVHNLKYGDRTHSALYFAQWMARAGKASLEQADMLVPVPLHPLRLLKRRYNQSALLANAISRQCHVPVYPQLLIRTRHTPSQAGLSSKERQRNVRGVFKLHPNYVTLVRNKHIIIVDDVMTTGATVTACTKILLKAGAKKVTILTLAKTIKQ